VAGRGSIEISYVVILPQHYTVSQPRKNLTGILRYLTTHFSNYD